MNSFPPPSLKIRCLDKISKQALCCEENLVSVLSILLILMSILTWITGKELERELNSNGDQFPWKKKVKNYTLGEKMRNASGYQGENERQ